MNEIETIRKELIENCDKSAYDNGKWVGFEVGFDYGDKMARKEFHVSNCPICVYNIANAERQGYEKARKEFIEWLEYHYLRLRKIGLDEEYQRLFAEKAYELKQSLSDTKEETKNE